MIGFHRENRAHLRGINPNHSIYREREWLQRRVERRPPRRAARRRAARRRAREEGCSEEGREEEGGAKRTPNAAFMKPMQPDAALGAVVGSNPMPRTEITKKLWEYIKRNSLQDAKERRMINADDKLKPVFGGKGRSRCSR